MQQQQMMVEQGQNVMGEQGLPEEPPMPGNGVAGMSPLSAAASLRDQTLQGMGKETSQL